MASRLEVELTGSGMDYNVEILRVGRTGIKDDSQVWNYPASSGPDLMSN